MVGREGRGKCREGWGARSVQIYQGEKWDEGAFEPIWGEGVEGHRRGEGLYTR